MISACKKLLELSASRGSLDDTSVMIIQLGHFLKNEGLCGYPLNSFCGNLNGSEMFHHKVS